MDVNNVKDNEQITSEGRAKQLAKEALAGLIVAEVPFSPHPGLRPSAFGDVNAEKEYERALDAHVAYILSKRTSDLSPEEATTLGSALARWAEKGQYE